MVRASYVRMCMLIVVGGGGGENSEDGCISGSCCGKFSEGGG